MKKSFSLALALIIVISMLPASLSHANSTNNTVVFPSTISYHIAYNMLFIDGTGEIPDYTVATLDQRPWHGKNFYRVCIGNGITRIGEYAFANFPNLETIEIPITTFVADNTSFKGASKEAMMKIHGKEIAYKDYPGIHYSSLESMAAGAPNGKDTIFILDTEDLAINMRYTRYPYLRYAYYETDIEQPWLTKKTYYAESEFGKVCYIKDITVMGMYTYTNSTKEPRSDKFMASLSPFLASVGYNYLSSCNVILISDNKILNSTSVPMQYVIGIDGREVKPNRSFQVIQFLPDGTTNILKDLDTADATVTFETKYPTGNYVLIYK